MISNLTNIDTFFYFFILFFILLIFFILILIVSHSSFSHGQLALINALDVKEPPIVVNDEKEIFLMLDIPYVPPCDRSIS